MYFLAKYGIIGTFFLKIIMRISELLYPKFEF